MIGTLRACWASSWSDRAILYRRYQSIDQATAKLAVVVLKMILTDAAVEPDPVTRAEHATDRRNTIVQLSPKGDAIGAGRRRERVKQWQRWLGQLSDEELMALAHGLTAIVAVVKKELETNLQQGAQSRAKKHATA